jgi:hypothetical protein
MKVLLLATGMVAATGLIILAGSARADPPPDGWTGSYKITGTDRLAPIIVCNKADDVRDIYQAGKEGGFQKAGAKAVAFRENGGECQVATLERITVVHSDDLGAIDHEGDRSHVWMVEIKTSNGERFVYYEVAEKPAESI